MAYISNLDAELPVYETVLSSPLELIVRLPIGRDDRTGYQYSIMVSLLTLPEGDYGVDAEELSFEVVAIGGQDPIYYGDGRATKQFLQGEERIKVLDAICYLAMRCVALRNPDRVYFTTKYEDTPRKALKKYDKLCWALREAGMSGGAFNSYHGLDAWLFVRKVEKHSA